MKRDAKMDWDWQPPKKAVGLIEIRFQGNDQVQPINIYLRLCSGREVRETIPGDGTFTLALYPGEDCPKNVEILNVRTANSQPISIEEDTFLPGFSVVLVVTQN